MDIPRAMLQEAIDFFKGQFNLDFKMRNKPAQTGEIGRAMFRGRMITINEFDLKNPGKSDMLQMIICDKECREQLEQAWAGYLYANYTPEESEEPIDERTNTEND